MSAKKDVGYLTEAGISYRHLKEDEKPKKNENMFQWRWHNVVRKATGVHSVATPKSVKSIAPLLAMFNKVMPTMWKYEEVK